jgi:hypothetical protein
MTSKNKGYNFQVRLIFFLLDKLKVDRAGEVNDQDTYLFHNNGTNITIFFWKDLGKFYGIDKNGDTYLQFQVCHLLAEKLGYGRL